ncbi:MAG TPA: HAD-IC family P-type ATPase [Egicoccus sp.]|nr:HAD-IC family P-type ATPase [Egicoccus sp.]HSK23175.1 HAD-IC family P-type ATPase [Egicoccus sp.]
MDRIGPPASGVGLTAAEVRARVEQGLANTGLERPSRSFREIVRANLLTRFNYLIGALLVVILVVAPIQDALFGLVAIANTLIGIAQELRAKWTLDRLSLIGAPQVRVVRDGLVREVDVDEVVRDDVIEVGAGDQMVVDAVTLEANGLELNEALVTGESDPVLKHAGDDILSGSFVAAGSGRVRATRVGTASFAGRLTEEARHFQLAQSELRVGIDRVLQVVTWLLLPVAVLLVVTQLRTQSLYAALAGSVAGTVAVIPEGLVLLTSLAFAASVIRLGRRNVLVQELPAVETLARVDVVCFDKTGTLTRGDIRLHEVDVIGDAAEVERALAALAANDPEPNATMAAVAAAYPTPPTWRPTVVTPFSSARKWSAVGFAGEGTWVFGAPDVLMAAVGADGDLSARVDAAVQTGHRVVLLARGDGPVVDQRLPADLRPEAVVLFNETLREDAVATLEFFAQQEVRAVLISGDHPRTVSAVARRVGIADPSAVTGAELPADPALLGDLVDQRRVFARVTPDDKRLIIGAMQSRGHVVAMTGDGVNDVLALKDADIGIALGHGAPATRNVAQVVLLGGDFSSLPDLVAEGRRVIANIERVANLFLTKTVYAILLAVAIGVAQLPFPFLPRHLSLVGALTIGIPAFVLALEPNDRRARRGFLLRAVAFSLPVGIAAAVSTFAAFWIAQTVEVVGLEEARTTATVTLFGLGVLVLRLLSRPLNGLRRALVYGAVVAFLVVALVPTLSDFFALHLPHTVLVLAAIGIVAVAGVVMEMAAEALEIRLHPAALTQRLRPRRRRDRARRRDRRSGAGSPGRGAR